MKLFFGDKSYLEFKRNWKTKKVAIVISTKTMDGRIGITSCHVSDEQLKELIENIDKEIDEESFDSEIKQVTDLDLLTKGFLPDEI